MYLFAFERIVRAAVRANGGSEDWALPYWDYGRPGTAKALPWVFRTPTLPDGTANPLRIQNRNPRRNQGDPLPDRATSSTAALNETTFTRPSGTLGFGGPQTGWTTFGSGFGALEQQPHNVVHVQVGGWMGDPDTAAQDPIFWLHHANIDRLWELWNRIGRRNTSVASWSNQKFDLFDVTGVKTTMACRDVVDIEGQLGYTYEGLPPRAEAAMVPEAEGPMPRHVPPEVVGATDQPLRLGSHEVATAFPIEDSRRRMVGTEAAAPRRVYLTVENVTGDAAPSTSYEVVLDMPGPEEAGEDMVAGVVASFGVAQASSEERGDAPHGQRFTFDVTDIVDRLRTRGLWSGDEVRVRFRPIEEIEEAEPAEISVGRVSLSYE
jgi:hypothetical protein